MLALLLSLMFIASELDRYIEDCKKRTHFCKDQFFCVLNMLDSSFKKNFQLELTEKCMQECNQVKPCARRTKCTFQCLSSGRNFEETRITPDIQKLDSQTEIGDVWAFFILIFFFLGIIFMILICWFCIDQCCKKEINYELQYIFLVLIKNGPRSIVSVINLWIILDIFSNSYDKCYFI